MRTLAASSVLALSLVSVGHGQAQQPARNTVYIAPNIARTLTISRSGVMMTTLSIPQGTLLSVTYDTAGSVLPANDGRFAFHGNVEIRALAASQKPANMILADAMERSPIQLTATDVDVAIAPR